VECAFVPGASTRTKTTTNACKEALTDLWQRDCLDKRRKRKPRPKLGLVQEPNPVGGPAASTQTMRSRSDLWDLQQKTSPREGIRKFLGDDCAAEVNGLD